jgi:hypothetical protein
MGTNPSSKAAGYTTKGFCDIWFLLWKVEVVVVMTVMLFTKIGSENQPVETN